MNRAFPPPRQPGITIHIVLIIILAAVSAAGGWMAVRSGMGMTLSLYALLAAAAFFPLPFLVYRLYSLTRATYILDRDKLTLSWGLRVEQIPVSDVEWVRPESDLIAPLPKPWLRLPGSVLGTRRHPDLGPVEFIASDAGNLLIVATARRIYVISPADAATFLQNFQRAIEMGSLTPAPAQSVYPSFVVAQAWESLLARYLWLAGVFVNIGLLLWVSLMTQSLGPVPFGFLPSGEPAEAVPAVRLIALPLSSIFFFIIGWLTGLAFYRRPEGRPAAFVVWAGGLVSSLLFLLAVMLLVTTPA